METVEDARKTAAKRHIRIEAALPTSASFVLAAQNEIKLAFQNILAYLLDDSIEEGRVRLAMTETEQQAHITFENTGMGMPQAQMDTFLFGQGDVSSKVFRGLRDSVAHIKTWGGAGRGRQPCRRGCAFRSDAGNLHLTMAPFSAMVTNG